MSDDTDIASEREQLVRDISILAHKNRRLAPIPLCEECEESRCHVTSIGVVWRFCSDCAEIRIRRS